MIFAILAGIPMFLSAFGCKEKVYIPPRKESDLEGLKVVFKDKKFMCLVIAAFVSSLNNLGRPHRGVPPPPDMSYIPATNRKSGCL